MLLVHAAFKAVEKIQLALYSVEQPLDLSGL